ncbi:hypothetical protein [Citreimonas salinaria]|uniref:Membrane protein YjdF n=1 Tax=Citreimonas salinaria TaxID=321339 RepID=A0A1H3LFQ8_9RHOB|nr:hypothetical protein [Citreimonas salinaria]SDY62784.1 hypothetical protein SAMN05444340_112110 [Citreimonas salinaria]
MRPKGPVVVLLIQGFLIIEIVTGLATAQWMPLFVAATTLALTLLPHRFARFFGLELPHSVLTAIVAFLFATLFLGEVENFYERFWWWDLLLHFFSALSIAAMAFLMIFMLFEGDRYAAPPSALAVLSGAVALAIGALWEIFEYGMDQLFGMNMQKSGLDDTMTDLMIDLAGAALGALSGYLFLKGRQFGGMGGIMAEFVALNRSWYRKLRKRVE